MHKIPVTVITGFLGAGKTTLIRHLLQNNEGRRIAVLVNEFGEIGIDGELLRDCRVCDDEEDSNSNIVELTNGCLCCTVQEEFLPAMQELLQRRANLDCMLIETSGLALPKPLLQAFRWPEIRTGATVDGVITVVDCEALATNQYVSDLTALLAQRQADSSIEHETPIEELFEDQLACADLVLLTKSDRVDSQTQVRVQDWLKQNLSPGVNNFRTFGLTTVKYIADVVAIAKRYGETPNALPPLQAISRWAFKRWLEKPIIEGLAPNVLQQDSDRKYTDQVLTDLTWNSKLGSGNDSLLTAKVYADFLNTRYDSRNSSQARYDNGQTSYGLQTQHSWKFANNQTLVYGFDYRNVAATNSTFDFSVNTKTVTYDDSISQGALFARYEIKFTPSFTANLGLRQDFSSLTNGSFTSPSVGTKFAVTDSTTVRANYINIAIHQIPSSFSFFLISRKDIKHFLFLSSSFTLTLCVKKIIFFLNP